MGYAVGSISFKAKNWLKNVFATKMDILVAAAMLMFILASTLKISLFNQILISGADKWTLRFKILTTLLIVIIVYPILFRFKSKALFVAFFVFQAIYIIVNLSYYLYFGQYLHLVQFISNFYEGSIAVLNSSLPKNPVVLIAFIDLPFFIILVLNYARANRLRLKLRVATYIVVIIAILLTVYTQYGHYKDNDFITQIAASKRIGESRIVERYGTLVNNAVGIYNQKDMQGYIDSFAYGNELVKENEAAQKADVFIIQVEALESTIVNERHSGSYVMPYLHSLTENNVYYPYMLAYHFGGGTSDCEFSIINSVEPLEKYPAIKLTAYNSSNSLVKRLTEASYDTLAFHGNIGRFYNRDLAFRSFGFAKFYDIDEMNMKDVGWGAPDDKVFEFALNKMAEYSGPIFSYVITMTSHGPFTNASNYYKNSLFDDINDKQLRDYYNSMSYVDRSIEEYVREIREQYENAYVFIFGDHTSKIETDTYKQSFMMIEDKTYEFVPLLIITPDNRKYFEDKNVASLLDLAPTILNATGNSYSIRTDGIDLLNPPLSLSKIPHRGSQWDRADLYRLIKEKEISQ